MFADCTRCFPWQESGLELLYTQITLKSKRYVPGNSLIGVTEILFHKINS